ncbi:hypothetical protein CON65_20450 [Bacillus pseudomycoides]|uniref:Uncharacterized protein n=1 Tax=Bacillus pseudomycoides TaxID=64104 RepID=A0AA91V955_9BACI|nr:hypothetical protein COO03_22395 [Bacillus sp. AFS098217]PED80866.1 hypothetical protein CON65_20450 [Bacillus pseudomycoides]PEU11312.1 hypothetical protein CN525_22520 [Bacillus sp. AFS014408]PFW57981.1 hypothetical protein COL20_25795 [Bacillus sp. AFS075034]
MCNSYGKPTRKNFNFLLLVVVLFQLGMQIGKGILDALQYLKKFESMGHFKQELENYMKRHESGSIPDSCPRSTLFNID